MRLEIKFETMRALLAFLIAEVKSFVVTSKKSFCYPANLMLGFEFLVAS